MRFAQALSRGTQSRQVREPLEYPKFVEVDGKPVLALTAEHEVELLGVVSTSDDTYDPSFAIHGATVAKVEEFSIPSNLLSAPEKRKPGRPRIIHSDKE